ncbi:MAG: hypothetical protein OQK98_09130 [Gammaproteobacteria bacterium]|nr:hypothetical protein [Gammaproteobacteria bacterium]
MDDIQLLSFSINNWGHLYSLEQAISHNKQLTGRKLSINSRILNKPFLKNHDTTVSIDFLQVDVTPEYPLINQNTHELGKISFVNGKLESSIHVDRNVFEELRKNLMEYADIEGIHIIITLGILSNNDHWKEGETLQIVKLDYAMKGDA